MSKPETKPIPAVVFLIADNLDAVLAAGEDLLALTHDCEAAADPRINAAAVRAFADGVRTLEMAVAARALQARVRAAELRLVDPRYRALIDLYIAGTAPLADAVAEIGDTTASDFHTGTDLVTFMRNRRIIAADAPGIGRYGQVRVCEGFLVAERVELGPLMDLCATFLDRLEAHYELYDDADTAGGATGRQQAAVSPASAS